MHFVFVMFAILGCLWCGGVMGVTLFGFYKEMKSKFPKL